MTIKFKTASALLAFGALLAACGGGGIGGTGNEPKGDGTLRVSLTDAPACGYDAVHVTVQKVRVHRSATAADDDSGWSEVVLNPARRIDLLTLTNGVLEELGQTRLPAGNYTQLRLVLAQNGATDPLANAVTPTNGSETALDTPSAAQSGLKLKVNVDVAADQVADLVIDFDACKSVVKRGNSGRYNLKPVISATVVLGDAGLRVEGYVAPAIALASTQVSVQIDGVPVKATLPDLNGKFVLYPVPVGSYDLVVTSAGHVTAVMTAVPVTRTSITTVNRATLPIAPPTATVRSVTGSVVPASATVRALQTLTGGPSVEVAWILPDALGGDFRVGLPIQAPVKTTYVPNPVSLAFVADEAVAGLYTLEAESEGVKQTADIDVFAPVPFVPFVFP